MLLDTIEHETKPAPAWSVVWLHGLGADGHDFLPIVPELQRDGWPGVRFVFPHAPVRAVTINNGVRMRAWYDILDLGFTDGSGTRKVDDAGVAESVAQVEALVANEVARGIAPGNVLLAGFSQGGAVALATMLRRAQPLAGVIALSTYLPGAHAAEGVLAPGATTQPVFMAHGRMDPVVPFQAGEASAARLRQLGFAVDWHAYAMPHSVCAEEVRDLGDWLSARFAATRG